MQSSGSLRNASQSSGSWEQSERDPSKSISLEESENAPVHATTDIAGEEKNQGQDLKHPVLVTSLCS